MMHESVSVIIPTRNRPQFLKAALRSVLQQTCPIAQIIVVDDASGMPEALSPLAALSPGIEIVRRLTRGGPAAARNSGLELARGEFLVFLDDDDLIHPRFVEDGLAVLHSCPDADAVFFLYNLIFPRGSRDLESSIAHLCGAGHGAHHAPRIVKAVNPVPPTILEQRPATAFLRFLVPINSCLIRKTALDGARFPESLRQGEDTYFWILLAAHGRRYVLDSRAYAFVGRHPGNTTRSRARYIQEIQACYEKLLEDGLLSAPDDVFLAHLKLFWFKCLTLRHGKLRHLGHVLGSPLHLVREIGFWFGNLPPRRRMLEVCLPK